MNPFEQQAKIPGIKKIIAISSGKGGVGKSTVATNLALALSTHAKVGLLDADVYGPSIPRMMGTLNRKPEVNDDQKIIPIQSHGISLMSIGYLVDEASAVVWRGPMLFKAMNQFLYDVAWGELDYLVIDLPPGTGDIQLTLAQKVPIDGAVCVTTPQNVALADLKKSIDMFERVKVPIIGVIENMAWLQTPGTEERLQLFPKGDLDPYLDSKKIVKLAQVPFAPSVGMAAEMGIPVFETHPDGAEAKAFRSAAKGVSAFVSM